jgi:hypothetical protein
MGARSGKTRTETPLQVVSDLISLVNGVMIPPGVIATWTPAEREEAARWASGEHLAASDNTGVRRTEQPGFVALATGITANPALAQLAVEGWAQHKQLLEEGGDFDDQDARELATAEAAQAAITGLLVLLESRAPAWQAQAARLLRDHREGIRTIDLFALLGRAVPSKEALDRWLVAGEDAGTLEEMLPGTWRARSAT